MTKLAEAILDRRVQSPNYFQGRLLAASDLSAERDAHLMRQRMLGRAIGKGIVEGLWVDIENNSPENPTINISAGFAINGEGQLLSVEHDQSLELTEVQEGNEQGAEACLFKPCQPPEIESVPSGEGLYILVMSPASRFEELASMSSLQTDKAGQSCGRKWAVPGVSFRLESFDPLLVPGISQSTQAALTGALQRMVTDPLNPSALSMLRNLTANVCFGTEELSEYIFDPFRNSNKAKEEANYGVIDYLTTLDRLTSCDMPLALIYWNASGIAFLDCWAVRRSLTPLQSNSSLFLSSKRLENDNQARLFQFQDHLESLLRTVSSPATLEVRDYFQFLPAAGLIPLSTTSTVGFEIDSFFSGIARRYPTQFINGEQLTPIFHRSLNYLPVDLEEVEMLWVHLPWQQFPITPADAFISNYVVYSSAHLVPPSSARFDVARWDFSNFTSCES